MWGTNFVHGLGGLGFSSGFGRLPPPRAGDGAAGADEGILKPEVSSSNLKWQFPVNAAVTSGGLAVVGDVGAQAYGRFASRKKRLESSTSGIKEILTDETFWQFDWVRTLRMGSYGFLLYGPISHWWYQFLDRMMPSRTFQNFSMKVVLNQTVLGPIIVAIVFAWNSAWKGQLDALPQLYRRDALDTLIFGWKFWTPVSFLNFGVVPLEARVLFMSTCAICWNFYLSTVIAKS